MRRHLDVIKRKEMLEVVLERMESLRKLDGLERRSATNTSQAVSAAKERSKRWSLF